MYVRYLMTKAELVSHLTGTHRLCADPECCGFASHSEDYLQELHDAMHGCQPQEIQR